MRGASAAVVPEVVPVLSRGKHRNSRKGACFMEMASYLAGERWSDHPGCTHPLVATVARLVNDYTTDDHRSRLAELIPSVIGLTTTDPRADARIALRCATAALPIASAKRQNVMAVSVLVAERTLAALDGRRARRPPSLQPRGARPRPARGGLGAGVRGQVRHVGRRVPSVRRSAHRAHGRRGDRRGVCTRSRRAAVRPARRRHR